jgi:cobalt-precorrin 5A hydrolase
MGGDKKLIVAGVGFRRDCSGSEIADIVHAASERAACSVGAIAAPAEKVNAPELIAAALALRVPLLSVSRADMEAAQAWCVTFSETVRRHVGVASVAEAAALSAAGAGSSLLLPRIAGGRATCALAQSA